VRCRYVPAVGGVPALQSAAYWLQSGSCGADQGSPLHGNRRMGRDVFTPQEGARTTMWVATARAADVANGGYYVPPGIVRQTSEAARDDGLGSELWAWT
jgi:hypothetical protein